MTRTKVGFLASGRGSNFQSIAEGAKRGEVPIDPTVVVSNVPGAPVLEKARALGVPAIVIDHAPFGNDRESWEREVVQVLKHHGVELVVFAGFMRLVTPYFVGQFPGRILNIHPSLLPSFPGAHGVRDALEAGAKVSGVTIHFVDASLDGGPVILQKAVPVEDDDTEASLAARVLEWEHRLYPLAVRLFAEGRLRIHGRRVMIDWSGINRPPSP